MRPERVTLSYFLRWQVAAFSIGAAAIHFAEISTHFEEYWVFGAFFFAVAWFQAASAVAIVLRSDRRLVLLVAVVNLVVIGIWIWSRTAGLPVGPEAGDRRRSEPPTSSRPSSKRSSLLGPSRFGSRRSDRAEPHERSGWSRRR